MSPSIGTAADGARSENPHFRVMVLCGLVLFLDGYDIAAAGYAIPSLVDFVGRGSSGIYPDIGSRQFRLASRLAGRGIVG